MWMERVKTTLKFQGNKLNKYSTNIYKLKDLNLNSLEIDYFSTFGMG